MSILVAVSELQDRTRIDCGLPAYSADTNVTTTDILDFVKRSAQKLSGYVQSLGADQHYFTLNTNLSTVANVAVVSLPANTLDVERIALVLEGTREVQLKVAPLDWWDPTPSYWDANRIPMYSIQGNTITLYPTPTAVNTLRVYYSVGLTVTASADILALRPNWDEYIVQSCNIFVRNRQEKACPEFMDAFDRAQSNIARQIKRDRGGIRQVRDVREPFFDRPHWYRWPW